LINKVQQNSIYLKQIFCFNNAKVFTDTSDQFSTSLLNNKVLKKKKSYRPQIFEHYCIQYMQNQMLNINQHYPSR